MLSKISLRLKLSDFINSDIEDEVMKKINNVHSELHATVLLYNSLGFFSKSDAQILISKISKALKVGGKFFLDVKNRDHILKEVPQSSVTEKGKDLMIDRIKFDPIEGTTTNQRIYIKDGKRYDAPFTMQMYHYSELISLMLPSNLEVQQKYGHWNGSHFDVDSKRIILVFKKTN